MKINYYKMGIEGDKIMNRVLWVKGTDDIKDAYKIRRKVFIEEQDVPEELEIDEIDKFADHVIIYHDNEAIGTARIFLNSDCKYYFGRVAVLKEYRGNKIGELLVKELLKKGYDKGAEEIYIHAQKHVEKFYRRLGFQSFGEDFIEAGIEHVNMIHKVK